MSDIHRKDDFLWSGVGLIYALVLWYCARNITGAVLLGQAAATTLLVSYSWQTLKLRRAIANPDKAAEINNFSVLQKINGLLKRKQPTVQSAAPSVETPVIPKVTEEEIAIPDTPVKDTAQTPTPSPVREQEVSVVEPPVIEQPAIEDKAVESVSEPVLEPKSSDKNQVEPTPKPIKADTSTQKTEIVKPQPVPKVVRDNRQDKAVVPAKNVEATPTPPNEPKANRESIVVSDKSKDKAVVPAKNVEATPTPSNEPKANRESADINTRDRQPASENKDVKSESQTTPETVPVKVKPVATSSLDSLETVEVAEVLEASEDSTINLDTDRSNIIEVTTTEINITTEVTTVEQKSEDDSDFQEDKS